MARILCNFDKIVRRNHAQLRMIPADQRFHTRNFAIRKVKLWLIKQLKFLLLDTSLQRVSYLKVLRNLIIELLIKPLITSISKTLGFVHRDIRLLYQLKRVFIVAVGYCKPRRCRQVQLTVINHKRTLHRLN
ncbi:hypothetical protein VBY75_05585 [Idiomarina sp. HB]